MRKKLKVLVIQIVFGRFIEDDIECQSICAPVPRGLVINSRPGQQQKRHCSVLTRTDLVLAESKVYRQETKGYLFV